MRPATSRRSFLTAGAFLLSTRPAWPQDNPIFSSSVKVVNVLATVRTKSGDIVTNLNQDDFLLAEDNRPQVIKYFSRVAVRPLILGLLIDTSASQRKVLDEEKIASYTFLNRVLRPQDKTFLVQFDYDTEMLQDLTSSKQLLQFALQAMQSPGPGAQNGGTPGGNGGPGTGTTLYDAVYLGSDNIMRTEDGRKALILLTDGVDHGSRVSMNSAIERAQRSDTLIYSIMFEGVELGHARAEGYKALHKMSIETGGGFFEVASGMSIETIYQRIEEELRSQYSIGYTTDRPPQGGDDEFRTISLKTRRKDLLVQAREGYYPAEE